MGYKDKWKYNQKYSSEVRKKGLLYNSYNKKGNKWNIY